MPVGKLQTRFQIPAILRPPSLRRISCPTHIHTKGKAITPGPCTDPASACVTFGTPLYLDCLRIHNPTLQPTLTPISILPKHKRLEPGLNFRITAVPSPILHPARVSGIIKRAESGSTMLKLHLLFGKTPIPCAIRKYLLKTRTWSHVHLFPLS